jgi:leucyl aminopeptidase
VPRDGPVEFHWYAAEEGGYLGSQAIVRYKRESGARIGAMMEFDMTAFVARNSTPTIAFIKPNSDEALIDWSVALAKEYSSIHVGIYGLPRQVLFHLRKPFNQRLASSSYAGSDYSSFTDFGYPSTFATEGDPMVGGFPGNNCYVHGVKDTMDVDDETGKFSLEHMAWFAELAIAFAVEQSGWDNKWS